MNNIDPTPATELLTAEQYAAHVGVSRRRVADYLRLGELPTARKVDGKWWIPADAVRVPVPGAAAMVSVRNRMAEAGVVALPTIEDAPEAPAAFIPRRRAFHPADAAALIGAPTAATAVRWARAGTAGLELTTGPHGEHMIFIEGR